MHKAVWVFLLFSSFAASAQSIITIAPQQCVWRAGDDPAWAAPNLDETGWQLFAHWKLLVEEPHLWARCHADLSSLRGTAHPAIQISLGGPHQLSVASAYQLFVNGARIGGAGDMRTGFVSMNWIRQYPLPAAALLTLPDIIALRITFRQPIGNNPLEIHAGDSEALAGRRASVILSHDAVTALASAVFFGVIGFMLLALFYYDRSRRELLYLSIVCVNSAAMSAETFCSARLMDYPAAFHPAVEFAGNIVAPFAVVLFFFALARRRVPRFYWVPVAVVVAQFALLGSTLLLPADAAMHSVAYVLAVSRYTLLVPIAQLVISAAPFVAFWPYRQISSRMRPLAILCMVYSVANIVWFVVETAAILLRLPSLFYAWEGGLSGASFFVRTCVLAALLGLLFRDQRLVTEERAMLAGEMQAASEIQRMLAPVKIDTAPGLHIDVAFHPMRDVGGDFYFCRLLGNGRQRVLVGDVSGKGAAAAMGATLLLGAAAARDSDSPAVLLAQLNRVLLESRLGGFATCLCADFAAAGEVTLANAGHLPPYCKSSEIELSSSLPLGIGGTAEYAETTLRLAPGETLTFLSDGVVEARNTTGELFGFERTRELSNQSAEKIAAAAQRFGQEDDITVLTVASVAKMEAAVV